MKKIFLLVVLFAVMSFGQSASLPGSFPTDQNFNKVAVMFTYDAATGTYNAVPGASFTLPTGLTGTHYYASGLDSIKGNDTATMNFANQFRSSFIALQDTNVYLAQTDTVIVECYHTRLGTWSSKAVGLYREYDGLITGGDVVIPGQGLTKKYWLLDEYISQVRVRWYYGANKGTRKVNIVFYGAN